MPSCASPSTRRGLVKGCPRGRGPGREQVIELRSCAVWPRARINRAQVAPARFWVSCARSCSLPRTCPRAWRPVGAPILPGRPGHAVLPSTPPCSGFSSTGVVMPARGAHGCRPGFTRCGSSPDLSLTLEIWDQQLAALSARITATRASIASRLEDGRPILRDDVADSRHLRLRLRRLASSAPTLTTLPADLTDVEAQTERCSPPWRRVREGNRTRVNPSAHTATT